MSYDLFRRFARDRRGNVAMIFGLCAIPMIFAVGLAVDYGNNMRRWSQLNAAADAAVLAAVTPGMMTQPNSVAQATILQTFLAQAQNISGVTFVSAPVVYAGPPSSSPNSTNRQASITYTAQLSNVFGDIFGQQWMTRSGGATANGAPQNINFFLLLDTSPSMEIGGTQADINTMLANTTNQANGGCAFACHESNPPPCPASANAINSVNSSSSSSSSYTGPTATDVCSNATTLANALGPKGTPYYTVSGGAFNQTSNPYTGIDNYQLASNIGVNLRIGMVATAAAGMVQEAIYQQNQALTDYGTSPIYQIAVYNFDVKFHNNFGGLRSDLSNLQTQLSANPSPIKPLEVYDENNLCSSYLAAPNDSDCAPGAVASGNSDTDTNIDAALSALDTPSSSTYIQSPGDAKAQQILLIVTDGLEDETVSTVTAGDNVGGTGGMRQQAPFAFNANVPSYKTCMDLQNRGVTIGVLYTAYVPLDNGKVNSWYDKHILQFQPGASLAKDEIGPAVGSCASNPSLFITVPPSAGPGAIATALQELFTAAQGSHLTQ